MPQDFAFRFDVKRSRPGRVLLDLGPASSSGFSPLADAIFQATTTMSLRETDRDLLGVTAIAGFPMQSQLIGNRSIGDRSGDSATYPRELQEQLLERLNQFTLVALGVGNAARDTFQVLGNRLLLPKTDIRRRGSIRIESNAEHAKIREHSLLILTGTDFLPSETIITPIWELCGAMILAFHIDPYEKGGGLSCLERQKLIAAVTEEAQAVTRSTPNLVLLQRGAEDTREPLHATWTDAFQSQQGVMVVAQSVKRGEQKYQVLSSRLPHISAGEVISVKCGSPETSITKKGSAKKSLAQWLCG